ncbi:hypothetical protein ABW20_dc0109228 [Dactylellina cionopaga]|nr:hypothetical protein ABW20_dc0109228 [Dactylellina cionopaga]
MVVSHHGNRKLYICRMFSKTHLTLESRPHRYSCCPCVPEPGPLYMAFDVKTALNLRIIKVEMEELENPSSVRELSITFETGILETYAFDGLAPNRIYQLNIRDKAVKTAALAHAYTQNHHDHDHSNGSKCTGIHLETPSQQPMRYQVNGKWRGMWQGFLHKFYKHPAANVGGTTLQQQQGRRNPAYLEVRTAGRPAAPQKIMRVRLQGRVEICHILTVPLDKQKRNTAIIAVPRNSNKVYVCGVSEELWMTGEKEELEAYMHHWLCVPLTRNECGEIVHISIAPLIHYDVGQRIGYMAILVGYSNGEIWMWRMNRAWRHLLPGKGVSNKQVGKEREEQQWESEADYEHLPNGLYRPEQTPCISSVLQHPLDTPLTKSQESALPVLNIIPPSNQRIDPNIPNVKAWKLAYLPGLKAVNFVARGVVILAADGKFVWGFDLREPSGFDKNTVYAPGAGAGLFGAVWGDGGEISVS